MPLKLPNLDDRRWNDLVEEGRSLIPAFAPEWTNYNPSDPGITLLELFAHLAELQIYRINQLNEIHLPALLRLINGPDFKGGVEQTIRELQKPHRAVTMDDFQVLTLAVNDSLPFGHAKIARAIALPNRDLESGKPDAQLEDAAGHVSVVIVPSTQGKSDKDEVSAVLIARVRQALEPARMLTTVIHVVRANYIEFDVRLLITISRRASAERVRTEIIQVLQAFFDPLSGGPDGTGWPFGRNVYVSEVYQAVSQVAGVIAVSRQVDPLTKRELPELMVPAHEKRRVVRNEAGEVEAVQLRPDELVALAISSDGLVMREEGTEN